uniref:Uncharacterized protein n=1 Tax=Anguilla anguilla TaxID=7936 RepID=A0A0E9TES2_ANGAN
MSDLFSEGLAELQTVRDLSLQQLHHDQELVNRLFEAHSGVLRSLPQGR